MNSKGEKMVMRLGDRLTFEGHLPAPRTIVRWQGRDEESTDVAIHLVSQIENGFRLRPFAEITFGTSRLVTKMEVDIGRGVRFTVACSGVYVDGALEQSKDVQGTASIGAFLAFTTRPVVGEITRTRYLDDLEAGERREVTIPAFARDVVCWQHPQGPVALRGRDPSSCVVQEACFDGIERFGLLHETLTFEVENMSLHKMSAHLQFVLGGFDSLVKPSRRAV